MIVHQRSLLFAYVQSASERQEAVNEISFMSCVLDPREQARPAKKLVGHLCLRRRPTKKSNCFVS
jgi:hypothetical protein